MDLSETDTNLTALEVAISKVRDARRELVDARVATVQRAGRTASGFFMERAEEVHARAQDLLRRGVPPSLRHVCGITDLEVPLNRVLGWLFDPAQPHGAGTASLLRLARELGLPTMVSDLRSGTAARVFIECSLDPVRWWREPDLVVETPNAVLLLENKVLAPESGPDQYDAYLNIVRELADERPWCAVLLARERRDPPPRWTRAISHAELAGLLAPLCEDSSLSAWARILVAMVVTDLRHDDLSVRIAEVRRLLDRAPDRQVSPLEVRRLSRLLESIPDQSPWEQQP
jgi:hypothetical protein